MPGAGTCGALARGPVESADRCGAIYAAATLGVSLHAHGAGAAPAAGAVGQPGGGHGRGARGARARPPVGTPRRARGAGTPGSVRGDAYALPSDHRERGGFGRQASGGKRSTCDPAGWHEERIGIVGHESDRSGTDHDCGLHGFELPALPALDGPCRVLTMLQVRHHDIERNTGVPAKASCRLEQVATL